jgi:hypothetical protein
VASSRGVPGRYGRDVLADWEAERAAARRPAPELEARQGTVVVHRATGFRGVVLRAAADAVELRGERDAIRLFALEPSAFLHEGSPVTLVVPGRLVPRPGAGGGDPAGRPAGAPARTASGSVAVRHDARVARGSRLLVEGVHDAELVEQVWGDDLRVEGVVVERLDGVDHLAAWLAEFRPGPARRVGVLVDHLVPGSKEERLARAVRHAHVLVTGTPYVDVWQAVRPQRLGLEAWPVVPRGTDWKHGIAAALGEPDLGRLWRRVRGAVRTYADLEPSLVGAVERLIDFVTAAADDRA